MFGEVALGYNLLKYLMSLFNLNVDVRWSRIGLQPFVHRLILHADAENGEVALGYNHISRVNES